MTYKTGVLAGYVPVTIKFAGYVHTSTVGSSDVKTKFDLRAVVKGATFNR